LSSSDALPTPNVDKLKKALKGLRPKGPTAEIRSQRLLAVLEDAALSMVLDSNGGKDDLRSFAQAFGREKLELRLSAAGPEALSELAARLDPKRRRLPKLTGELVELVMRKLGAVKEAEPGKSAEEAPRVPTRDAIFAHGNDTSLRAFLDAYPQDLLKRIRLEHGLMYSALPPPKSKRDEIEHIVASVFRRTQGSILDQMDFAPRARSSE
jgi:hypothetical protein